jgi:peptide/nickel transport system permease protein
MKALPFLRSAGGKVLRLIAGIFIVTFLTTALTALIPGSPAQYIAGDAATPELIDQINEEYGFNDPFLVRYADWVANVLQGDLGKSPVTGTPVADAIAQRLPVTIELVLLALLLSMAIAIPLAIASARRPGSTFDRVVSAITFAQVSIPVFLTGLVLVLVVAILLRWLPAVGWVPITQDPLGNLRSAILPVVTIALAEVVALQRVLRADLISTLQEDYIALARAKRLSINRIMWLHALKPSSFSLVTLSGVQIARLIAGTVIVERIFLLPGLGSLLLTSIGTRDLIVLQGIVAFMAVAVLLINFALDFLYGVLDPRARAGGGR